MAHSARREAQHRKPWRAYLPPLDWLPRYSPGDLWPDAVAGLTLAAYNIPVAIAYAALAGLPPQTGLYACMLGGLAYAALGTSGQLGLGPTSSISMLLGSALAAMAAGDPGRLTSLASLAAVMVAATALGAWCFRLGSAVSFISDSVLSGFKVGVGLVIAASQLPSLFGIQSGGEHFFDRLSHLAENLGQTHAPSLVLGLVALGLLVLGDRFLPGRPVPLAVVALGILLVAFSGLRESGVRVIGEIPGGFPRFGLSGITWGDAKELIPIGMACFMLAFVEGISAARTLALKHRTSVDPEQEMLAVGAANLAAGLGQGFPVAGGMSQSVVNDIAGARSPLAGAFSSAALALVLVFLTAPFGLLPLPVLAALVLLSVVKLVSPRELRYLYRVSRLEFWVALVAFGGVLLLGILKGVLLAVIVSLLLLLKRATHPRVVLLGYVQDSKIFAEVLRHPQAEQIPGVMVFRVEGALLYFNADNVKVEVARMLAGQPAPVKLAVFELACTPAVDLAGAKALGELGERLGAQGVEFRLAEATEDVAGLLRAAGAEKQFGTGLQASAWLTVESWRQGPG